MPSFILRASLCAPFRCPQSLHCPGIKGYRQSTHSSERLPASGRSRAGPVPVQTAPRHASAMPCACSSLQYAAAGAAITASTIFGTNKQIFERQKGGAIRMLFVFLSSCHCFCHPFSFNSHLRVLSEAISLLQQLSAFIVFQHLNFWTIQEPQ